MDSDLKYSWLYGQSWLSLEKLFEDAVQERVRQNAEEKGQTNVTNNILSLDCDSLINRFEQALTIKGHQVDMHSRSNTSVSQENDLLCPSC